MCPHGNKQVADAEILSVIDNVSEPVASVAEIAEQLPISKTAINKRLNQLRRDDEVERKDVGSGNVWWVTD